MSSGGGAGPLVPTFHGFVESSMDALILFEACLSGKLHHVPRRPHDRERNALIKSGSVFIYEENASGIKRWTDGVAWSPSRILGNFLIYRELEKPFPPGEKKRAMKRKRTSMPGEPYPRRDSEDVEGMEQQQQQQAPVPQQASPPSPPSTNLNNETKPENPVSDHDKELERRLIGSLVDSYGFRPDGLLKKTMSISVNGISHHMVSYYKLDDVKNGVLQRPLSDPRLQNISVRHELYMKQNFRSAIEENEHYAVDQQMNAHPGIIYSGVPSNPYAVRPGQYFAGQQYPAMYAMNNHAPSPYGGVQASSWQQPQQPQQPHGNVAYGHPTAYAGQPYGPYYSKPAMNQAAGGAVKHEDENSTPQSQPYGHAYPAPYPNMQRSNSHSTPTMMQAAYHTPSQQSPATFGGRASYGNSNMTSPSTNSQPQHQPYGNPSAQYAVRSPPQHYNMQAPNSGSLEQSSHVDAKSPNPAGANSGVDGQMSYRQPQYGPPPSEHGNSDVNGLGITGGAGPYGGQTQQGHPYPAYPPNPQQSRQGGMATAGADYGQ